MTIKDNHIALEKSFDVAFQTLHSHIKMLPPNELSYYLVLVMATLKKENKNIKTLQLIDKMDRFALSLHDFYQEKTPESLNYVIAQLEAMMTHTKINSFSMKLKTMILKLCSVITAFVGGILCGFIGFSSGLFSDINFFKGAKIGLITGFGMGVLLGSRTPDRLFRSQLESKLLHCFHHVKKISHELHDKHLAQEPPTPDNTQQSGDYYQNETKQYIIDTFFKDEQDKEKAFNQFLTSTQSFQICTTPSQLVDRKLDGALGHHALIRFKINGIVAKPLEYGNRDKSPRWVNQAEAPRQISGQKLFEMMTLHTTLQETHRSSLRFKVTTFKTGDNDCYTYVDKILIGTQQQPAAIKRFADKIDTWLGRHVVKHCVRYASEMSHDEIQTITPHYHGVQPKVSFFSKPLKKETIQAIPGWATDDDKIIQGPIGTLF